MADIHGYSFSEALDKIRKVINLETGEVTCTELWCDGEVRAGNNVFPRSRSLRVVGDISLTLLSRLEECEKVIEQLSEKVRVLESNIKGT